jgi:peptide/nickel transport system permease protein
MMRHLLRRGAHTVWLVLAVSLLSFLMLALAPGDFFTDMRLNPQIAPATVQALRERYGLDDPLPARYLRWLSSTVRGDFGFSFAYNTPAASLLWPRAQNTLLLTIPATLVAWLLAVPLGVRAAAARGGWIDRLSSGATSLLLAIPDLLLPLLLLAVAVRTGWLPTGGMRSPGAADAGSAAQIRDVAAHMLLPVCALTATILPIVFRHVRSTMAAALDAPPVRAARGHGIPRRRILVRHALPLAANPLLSLLGFSIATLLSASLLVEIIMGWPGLGPLLLEAILARDVHLVIGAVMFSTAFLVAGTLVADALLLAMDPRIRLE